VLVLVVEVALKDYTVVKTIWLSETMNEFGIVRSDWMVARFREGHAVLLWGVS
jgi:hypothetical protein